MLNVNAKTWEIYWWYTTSIVQMRVPHWSINRGDCTINGISKVIYEFH
jgi:hypothetical protein